MKRFVAAVLLMLVGASVGIVLWERHHRGLLVHARFAERSGVEAGDRVYLKDIEIGRVEAVELAGGQVRLSIRLDEERSRTLPGDLTFTIEPSRGKKKRHLEAHVLDPESPPVQDGETVEGVGSKLELVVRQAARKARKLVDQARDSDWMKRAADKAEQAIRAIEDIDWKGIGSDVEDSAEDIAARLGELASATEEEARRRYRELEPRIQELGRKLEAVGRSEEAERLRRRFHDIWPGGGGAEAEPRPSGPSGSP